MSKMAIRTPRGTRDFLPPEMIRREYLLEMIRMVFHDYGFEPMETPAFESWELLSKKGSGGEAVKDEIYFFQDKAKRGMGLRFDLTVPMARVIASNPQLPKPFKRYQISRVWRYDRPQAGRYREFWQADADVVGARGMDAEAECLASAVSCLKQLGFRKFRIRLNNRKILNGIVEVAGVKKEKHPEVFRALDKLEKIGEKAVLKEIGKVTSPKKAKQIMDAVGERGSPSGMLKDRPEIEKSTVAGEGVDELRQLVKKCRPYGISKHIEVDFSLVRGLDYYTGPIFEVEIESEKNVGSAAGGGRYDNLIELYGGRWTPAVGISLGVERIYEIMQSEGMFDQPCTRTELYIAPVDDTVRDECVKMTQRLRERFANAETDLMGRDIKKQLAYANSRGIRTVVIVGQQELKSGRLTMRDMETGKERTLTLEQLLKNFGSK